MNYSFTKLDKIDIALQEARIVCICSFLPVMWQRFKTYNCDDTTRLVRDERYSVRVIVCVILPGQIGWRCFQCADAAARSYRLL